MTETSPKKWFRSSSDGLLDGPGWECAVPIYELSNGKLCIENPEKNGPFEVNGGITRLSTIIWLFFLSLFPCNTSIASFGCHVFENVMMPSAAIRFITTVFLGVCLCVLPNNSVYWIFLLISVLFFWMQGPFCPESRL